MPDGSSISQNVRCPLGVHVLDKTLRSSLGVDVLAPKSWARQNRKRITTNLITTTSKNVEGSSHEDSSFRSSNVGGYPGRRFEKSGRVLGNSPRDLRGERVGASPGESRGSLLRSSGISGESGWETFPGEFRGALPGSSKEAVFALQNHWKPLVFNGFQPGWLRTPWENNHPGSKPLKTNGFQWFWIPN